MPIFIIEIVDSGESNCSYLYAREMHCRFLSGKLQRPDSCAGDRHHGACRGPLTSLQYHSIMIFKGLGALNCRPIIPRDASLSDSRGDFFSSQDETESYFVVLRELEGIRSC